MIHIIHLSDFHLNEKNLNDWKTINIICKSITYTLFINNLKTFLYF